MNNNKINNDPNNKINNNHNELFLDKKIININDFSIIILWIGVWGLIENLIDKYIGNNIYNRILLFSIIIILAFLLNYFTIKFNL